MTKTGHEMTKTGHRDTGTLSRARAPSTKGMSRLSRLSRGTNTERDGTHSRDISPLRSIRPDSGGGRTQRFAAWLAAATPEQAEAFERQRVSDGGK